MFVHKNGNSHAGAVLLRTVGRVLEAVDFAPVMRRGGRLELRGRDTHLWDRAQQSKLYLDG
jgi:hypothetical protein